MSQKATKVSYIKYKTLVQDDFSCTKCSSHGGPTGDADLYVTNLSPNSESASYTTRCGDCIDTTDQAEETSTQQSTDNSSFTPIEQQNRQETVQESEPVTDNSEEQKEQTAFFPGKRMLSVKCPSTQTKRILEQTATLSDHSEDTTKYLYKFDEEDIWTAGYDEKQALIDDLFSVIGDEEWHDGFEAFVSDAWERANTFTLSTHSDGFTVLSSRSERKMNDVAKRHLSGKEHLYRYISETKARVVSGAEADVKEILYENGHPVIDNRRLDDGAELDVELTISLRDYQSEWVDEFVKRGNGVFCGPSGSGKTVAAMGAIARQSAETLIIVPRRELASQWKDELLDKTTLSDEKIGEYHGNKKQIRPITIATYQTATKSRHRDLFNEQPWGLVIADEAHHSPSSAWKRFRNIQSKRRLGLSATPVRETDEPKEVFTLIGPPIGSDWGRLFDDDWVARPDMDVIYVPWESDHYRSKYESATGVSKIQVAAGNPKKTTVIQSLVKQHRDKKSLVFVDYIDQGKEIASKLDVPFVYGETSFKQRQKYYTQLKNGEITTLIVSRIGDEGIDLPDAEVAILASTRGNSRQQTGQRSGRTMRPEGESNVYMLLTRGSGEQDWGRESTQYLVRKGATVTVNDWEDIEHKY